MDMQTEVNGRPENLVYNSNFFYYFNTTMVNDRVVYNHPHGWKYEDSGNCGMITFNVDENCCEIRKSAGHREMSLSQEITSISGWKSEQENTIFTAVALVGTPDRACELVFSLSGKARAKSSFVTLEPHRKQKVSLQMRTGHDPGELEVSIGSTTPGAVIYIYSVSVYESGNKTYNSKHKINNHGNTITSHDGRTVVCNAAKKSRL